MSSVSAITSEFRLYHNDGDPRKILKRKLRASCRLAQILHSPEHATLQLRQRKVTKRKIDEAGELLKLAFLHLNEPYNDDNEEEVMEIQSACDSYLKTIDWRVDVHPVIHSTTNASKTSYGFLARN